LLLLQGPAASVKQLLHLQRRLEVPLNAVDHSQDVLAARAPTVEKEKSRTGIEIVDEPTRPASPARINLWAGQTLPGTQLGTAPLVTLNSRQNLQAAAAEGARKELMEQAEAPVAAAGVGEAEMLLVGVQGWQLSTHRMGLEEVLEAPERKQGLGSIS
jgi:hypothetical protein